MNPSARLTRLYRQIDPRTARLVRVHRTRLRCRQGCPSCCVDGIRVFSVEAEKIRRLCTDVINASRPHPPGACAFLDTTGGCRIYPHRPYICRTQGLPLRWIEERGDDPDVERRDICPLNAPGPPVEGIPEEHCWSIGPFEERLAELQHAATGDLRRTELRSLFNHS